MTTISVDALQRDFPAVLKKVAEGEVVVVTSDEMPVAEITRPNEAVPSKPLPVFGLCKGEFVVPDDFDDPLPEDILRDFEGD